jgi:hypothetical protein
LSEDPAVGVEPGAQDSVVAPMRPSGPVAPSVGDELAVDHVGQPPFEAAQGLSVTLACGAFALVVGPTGGVPAELGDGHDVQAGVQLPIPGAGQAMTDDVAGGHFDRCGAVERGERGGGAEAGDRADSGEDLAGQQGADAVELGQGASGSRDGRCDVLIGGGDASIQAADLG